MKKLFLVLSLLFIVGSLRAAGDPRWDAVDAAWVRCKKRKLTIVGKDEITFEIFKVNKDDEAIFYARSLTFPLLHFRVPFPRLLFFIKCLKKEDYGQLMEFACSPAQEWLDFLDSNGKTHANIDESCSQEELEKLEKDLFRKLKVVDAEGVLSSGQSVASSDSSIKTGICPAPASEESDCEKQAQELVALFAQSAAAQIVRGRTLVGVAGEAASHIPGRLLKSKTGVTAYFLADDASSNLNARLRHVSLVLRDSNSWKKDEGVMILQQLLCNKDDLQQVGAVHKIWPLVWASLSGLVSITEFATAVHELVKRHKLAAKLQRYEETYGVDSDNVHRLRKVRSGMAKSAAVNAVIGAIAAGIGAWQFTRGWRKGVITIKS